MKRAALLAAVVLALAVPAAAASPITVFAAASLTEVLPRIDASERYSFAGSDALATQIRNGAPADVYAAASPTQPELLYRDRVVYKPRVFATNRLVVVVPRANPARIGSVYDLRRRGVKLVVGTAKVPIGAYTRQVLANLGIADAVLANVVSEETDVKGIVAKVALGQADAGFVYATDVRAVAEKTKTIAIPSWAQPSVRYEIAVVRSTKNLHAAKAFVSRVLSKTGRRALVRAGFGLPKG